jgi:hypothetical protein
MKSEGECDPIGSNLRPDKGFDSASANVYARFS